MALHHILAEPRRPPSGLDLDLSLHSDMAIALANACLGTCMVFESCPLEREGPLGCGHVCHTLMLVMAKRLLALWVLLHVPQSQRFPLAVC